MIIFFFLSLSVASAYFAYIVTNNEVSITGLAPEPGYAPPSDLEIPATLEDLPVTAIADYAFYYNESLTSVAIPESVITIGRHALAGCSSLTSIVVSASNTAYSSEDGVLFNKGKTHLIQYPARKSGIYDVPDGVTNIGDTAFFECWYLTSVTIPVGVISIGNSAFSRCSGLRGITLPTGVSSIGDCAFYECRNLAYVDIPDSVTSIGACAFSDCYGLTNVVLSSHVANIGDRAFGRCTFLAGIEVSASNPTYSSEDGALYDKDKTHLIQYPGAKSGHCTIPASVTSIGDYAFELTLGLTSVIIPDSVTYIGDYAFSDSWSLTTVVIRGVVTRIGDYAFYRCLNLTRVCFADSPPESTGLGLFFGCTATIHYRYGTVGWDGAGGGWNYLPLRLWPQFMSASVTSSGMTFTIKASYNQQFVVEAASSLSSDWQAIYTGLVTWGESYDVTDDSADADHPSRFYRIVLP